MSAPIPYYGPVGCELAPGHEFRHFFVTGPGETVEWPDRNADGTYSVGPS